MFVYAICPKRSCYFAKSTNLLKFFDMSWHADQFIFCLLCRYEILTPSVVPKGFMDGKKAAQKMVCLLSFGINVIRGGGGSWIII